MKATIKQIMPAPGWRLLIAYRATPDKTVTEVHPAVGWGIVEYTNDPRDVRILGFPARFEEVQLLVLWHTDISAGAVLDVKSLDDDGTIIKILPPGVVPTEEDALVLLEDLKSADE